MDSIDWLGHAGSLLSSITFIPQVYQTWKTKSVADLNVFMMLAVFVSTVIWIIYGFFKGLVPVMICNSVICCLSLLLLYFKFKFGRKA